MIGAIIIVLVVLTIILLTPWYVYKQTLILEVLTSVIVSANINR